MLDQALRVFGLLGAVLVAVIEIEWERLLLLVRFTEYWVGRAVVQVGHSRINSAQRQAEQETRNTRSRPGQTS